jgi:hypothetical protein
MEIVDSQKPLNRLQESSYGFQLLISGYLFDNNSNYIDLPKDVIYVICTSATMKFTYESDFDQKGALAMFRNCKSSTIIKKENVILIPGKHRYFNDRKKTSEFQGTEEEISKLGVNILGQTIAPGAFVYRNSDAKAFIIDLQEFKLNVDHITYSISFIKGFSRNDIDSIKCSGSNDRIAWSLIPTTNHVRENNNPTSTSENKHDSKKEIRNWKTDTKSYFQFFRFCLPARFNIDAGSDVSGIEMYGLLR